MNYELGHIYVIWDIENHNLVYYGSTQDLEKRIKNHKNPYNKCTSNQIINRKNYEYAILETHENIDEYDLVERERWYILNNVCINKQIPHRTRVEWCQDNIDYHSKWCQDNKEKMLGYYQTRKKKKTNYYQDNKEKIADYYQKNKEKIAKKNAEKFVCECGGKFTYGKKSNHEKSHKHLKWVQSCKLVVK